MDIKNASALSALLRERRGEESAMVIAGMAVDCIYKEMRDREGLGWAPTGWGRDIDKWYIYNLEKNPVNPFIDHVRFRGVCTALGIPWLDVLLLCGLLTEGDLDNGK